MSNSVVVDLAPGLERVVLHRCGRRCNLRPQSQQSCSTESC